jgi:hypothetical protein
MLEKQISIVQCYIKHRTNKDVNIVLRDGFDVLKLQRAYNIAVNWFEENNVKITVL